jgi:hypothetical protein
MQVSGFCSRLLAQELSEGNRRGPCGANSGFARNRHHCAGCRALDWKRAMKRGIHAMAIAIAISSTGPSQAQTPSASPFQIVETSIDDIHAAFRSGRLTACGRFCCKTILRIRARKIDSRSGADAQR